MTTEMDIKTERCKECGTIIKAYCPLCGALMTIYEYGEYYVCNGCGKDSLDFWRSED